METIYDLDRQDVSFQPSALTIGNFDGFHRGHQSLVAALKQKAEEKQLYSSVLSFYPHPEQVLLSKSQHHFQLFDHEDLKLQIEKQGIDYFILQKFTKKFSLMSAEDFFYQILIDKIKMKALVVGADFSFGRSREASMNELRAFCKKNSVSLTEVPSVMWRGQRVSSTRIRQAAMRGDMESVNTLLNRPFSLSGIVKKGDGRGKKLGFPTANILSESSEFLRKGVYLTLCELGGKKYNSITNLGYRPTFSNCGATIYIETFIFETLPDFYGQRIIVEFLQFLRNEIKFASVESLVSQINKDLKKAKIFFHNKSPN